MFFGWSAKVAHEFGAFHAIFNAGGGYGMAAFHSLWLHLPYKKVNSEEFPLPGFRKGHRIHTKQLPEHFQVAVAGDSWCSFSQDMFRDWLESDGILFNTMEEIDHVGMEYFRQQIGCSVWPVGPILSSLGSKARAGDDAEATMHLCMKWRFEACKFSSFCGVWVTKCTITITNNPVGHGFGSLWQKFHLGG
ncbi:UDP-glycosyltransferase 92A1 [Camellia lanceoleosa]|nr:UDP-glycosyltransferase 92A1 [Camellia lanceoleosa]